MKKSNLDKISHLINDGINIDLGNIYVTGGVDTKMYKTVLKGLALLNQVEECPVITVVLNTDGGDVSQSLAIYDLIKMNEKPVDIIAIGECLSSGLLIMQAARHRLATKNCQLMSHNGTEKLKGEANTVKRQYKHFRSLEKRSNEIFIKRMSSDEATVQRLMARDFYMSAEEAKAAGFIDGVTIE